MRIFLAAAAVISLPACDQSPATETVALDSLASDASLLEGALAAAQETVWFADRLVEAAKPKPEIVHRGLAVRIRTGALRWEHILPAAAVAIPELRKSLDEDREELLDADRSLARSVWNEQVYRIKNPVKNPKPISLAYRYQVVADLPRWLSLSERQYQGNDKLAEQPSWISETLWDKTAKKRLNTNDLITSAEAMRCAIDDQVIRVLRRQKSAIRKTMIENYDTEIREFGPKECKIPAEYRILLGSTNGKTFDRIGVMIRPLSRTGPPGERNEHAAEITLPVTPAIVEAIKPQYRDSFSLGA